MEVKKNVTVDFHRSFYKPPKRQPKQDDTRTPNTYQNLSLHYEKDNMGNETFTVSIDENDKRFHFHLAKTEDLTTMRKFFKEVLNNTINFDGISSS